MTALTLLKVVARVVLRRELEEGSDRAVAAQAALDELLEEVWWTLHGVLPNCVLDEIRARFAIAPTMLEEMPALLKALQAEWVKLARIRAAAYRLRSRVPDLRAQWKAVVAAKAQGLGLGVVDACALADQVENELAPGQLGELLDALEERADGEEETLDDLVDAELEAQVAELEAELVRVRQEHDAKQAAIGRALDKAGAPPDAVQGIAILAARRDEERGRADAWRQEVKDAHEALTAANAHPGGDLAQRIRALSNQRDAILARVERSLGEEQADLARLEDGLSDLAERAPKMDQADLIAELRTLQQRGAA